MTRLRRKLGDWDGRSKGIRLVPERGLGYRLITTADVG
jgi:hypothetical protein